MTTTQRKRRPAGETAAAADKRNEGTEAYDPQDQKARLTKSDAARLMSIWLDQVYDDDVLPASAFKLTYRIAKRCRATFAKQGAIFSFEGQERLAASASISGKQVRNLLKMLAERGHLRVVQIGKKKTNRMFPIISDRKSSSGHIEADDRQPVSAQSETVTGNPVPSDRKSSSDMTGNGFPLHRDEGVEGRVVDEGGEGVPPSPLQSTYSSSNRKSSLNEDDARLERASSDEYSVGDIIHLNVPGDCTILKIGIDPLTGNQYLAVSRGADRSSLIVIPVENDGTPCIDEAWPASEDERLVDEIRWRDGTEIISPAPKTRRRRDAAA